jgi:hypothetical protein
MPPPPPPPFPFPFPFPPPPGDALGIGRVDGENIVGEDMTG